MSPDADDQEFFRFGSPLEQVKGARTPEEIKAEITALKALRPTGKFYYATAQKIRAAINELKESFDQTSGEWEEMDEGLKSIIMETHDWKIGLTELRPSTGWGGLVE